ncbi:MAG TPA: sigma-70 family RNA polymerase sigma factor [Pyrinomonadaceae bacterium]|nr:sigma-70 family RNA polymerase sigma factor [Pyrinomonadaceae bacterium]
MLLNNSEKNKQEIPLDRVRQFVYKLIRRRVPSPEDAEDLTQSVLLKGWRSNENNFNRLNFETEEDFLRYFSIIARNEIKRFQSEQIKTVDSSDPGQEILLMIQADYLSAEYCLEIIGSLCSLPLKHRLVLILGQPHLLNSFRNLFSMKTIAQMLDINESWLEKLANEIPLSEEDLKAVVEIMMGKKIKTQVSDERWKARKGLKEIIYRGFRK